MVRINGTGPINIVEPEQICIATVKQPVLINANASVVIDNDANARPRVLGRIQVVAPVVAEVLRPRKIPMTRKITIKMK